MKRFAFAIGLILVILVAGALIAPQLIDWNAYRARLAETLKTSTGFELDINGDLDLAVLPYPRLSASDITLRSPRSNTPVLKLDRVSLNIAIMPLFSSKIEVGTMRLDSPTLTLKVLPDGNGNWMTDKLANAADKNTQKGEQQDSGSKAVSAIYQRIGLQNVAIRNGNARFIHTPSGREYALRNFNADIDAKTLFGPYNIDSSYRFQNRQLNATAKVGRYTRDQASLPLKITLSAKDSEARLDYSGVADFSQDSPVLQGEFDLMASKLRNLIGLAPVKADIPQELAGASLRLKTMMTSDSGRTRLEDLILKLGPVQHSGHFKFNYNDPEALRFDTKLHPDGDTDENAPSEKMLWQALGRSGIEGKGVIKPSVYSLHDTNLITGQQRHGIEVKYSVHDGDSKPTIDISVNGTRLDLDKLGLTASPGKNGEDEKPKVKSGKNEFESLPAMLADGVQSPFHVKADIGFEHIRAMGRDVEKPGIRVSLRHDRFDIEHISVAEAYNVNWQLQGKIADISDMTGFDLQAKAEISELAAFAGALLDKRSDAYDLRGDASARIALEGSADKLDFTGNLKGMKLNVEASGRIKNALTAPKPSSGNIRIRHPDSAELVKVVVPGYEAPPILKRPIDLYGEFAPDKERKGYHFKKLSGRVLGTNIQGSLGGHLRADGKPSLKADLEFTTLNLTDSMQAGSDDGAGATDQNNDKNRKKGIAFSRKAIDLQALHTLNLEASLQGRWLKYAGWQLQSPEIELTLKDGKLAIEKADGKLFGGPVHVSGMVRAGAQKGEGHAINIKANAENIAARDFSNAITGSQLDVLEGDLTIDSELQTSGISPAALMLALNGEGNITSSDFVINGIELNALAHALRRDVGTKSAIDNLMRFMRSPFRGGKTRFTEINGEFDIEKGVISPNNTKLEAKGFTMKTKGEIDLPRWTLDLMNTVSFPNKDDVPPFDIIVRGPLDDPARGLRDQMMRNYLEKRLQNRAQRFITDELNQLFGGDLKTGAQSGQKKRNDAKKGQGGGADTSKRRDTRDKPQSENQLETIEPDKIKGNSADDDKSELDKITPEDAVRGVLDRLKSSQ